MSGIYFIPVPEEKKPRGFTTRLVSPGELKPDTRKPRETIRPPVIRIRPVPIPQRPQRPVPLPPPMAAKPQVPGDAQPVVPGFGTENGRPVPEDQSGKRGKGEEGEGTGRRTIEGEEDGKKNLLRSRSSDKPGFLDRKQIFDRGTIDAIARKDTAGEAKKDETITFSTSEYRYAGYMKKLKGKIESIWVYPPEAWEKGIYGDLKIRFTIKKNGELGAIDLVRTSGYKMLDDAAMKALKDGEPYWPLPDEWGIDSYTILGHFVYFYGGYQLR